MFASTAASTFVASVNTPRGTLEKNSAALDGFSLVDTLYTDEDCDGELDDIPPDWDPAPDHSEAVLTACPEGAYDFTLTGAPSAGYDVTFTISDNIGGTNTVHRFTGTLDENGQRTVSVYLTSEWVALPNFSLEAGPYMSEQSVTLDSLTEGATIHYTTDGTEPTEASPAYVEPITISQSVALKARAYKGAWLPSDTESAEYVIVPPTSAGAIKDQANDSWAAADNAIVTAAFDGFFYIEADDRSSGIRVDKSAHGFAQGMRAEVIGKVQTNGDGERYIAAVVVAQDGTGSIVPVGMNNRDIGGGDAQYDPGTGAGQRGVLDGSGLNNIGLLVKAWGRVTSTGSSSFTIDDGSGLGVKALLPSGVGVDVGIGDYVEATGVSSCEQVGADLLRVVRVRGENDVRVIEVGGGLGPQGWGASSVLASTVTSFVQHLMFGTPVKEPLEGSLDYALGQPDGSIVTLKGVQVVGAYDGYFGVRCLDEPLTDRPSLLVECNSYVESSWSVDVEGVIVSLGPQQRAVTGASVFLYTDADGHPAPPLPPMSSLLLDWPWKKSLQ